MAAIVLLLYGDWCVVLMLFIQNEKVDESNSKERDIYNIHTQVKRAEESKGVNVTCASWVLVMLPPPPPAAALSTQPTITPICDLQTWPICPFG